MPDGYSCPGEVHCGRGAVACLPQLLKDTKRVLVFTTAERQRHGDLLARLGHVTDICIQEPRGEPSVATLENALRLAGRQSHDCIVAIGGGSIMDMAKAVAALLTNPGGVMRYLEVVGEGQPLAHAPVPVIAVPTTFGTGSEVTRNAVIGVPEHSRKVSLRDERMVPKVAIVDPDMGAKMPGQVAASSGIDALVHVCEAYVCNKPCPGLAARSRRAVAAGFTALPELVTSATSASREVLAEVSLCGGLCIANARLGAVHGLAGVIGGMTGAGHGAICGALFAPVFAANVHALAQRGRDNPSLARMGELAGLVRKDATAADLADLIAALVAAIGLRSLDELGLRAGDHAKVAAAAQASSSMQGNPLELTGEELCGALAAAQ